MPQRPSPVHFTLMNLNLRFGLADDGENGWQHRRHAFPHLLSSCPADFYCFQEANDFQVTFLNELLQGYGFIGMRHRAPDRWQHNVIFYRRHWRCVHNKHFYLSPTPDVPSKFDQSRWPRQCTMGTFRNGPATLTLVNTHFDFADEVQRRSAELIRGEIAKLPSQRPVVLAGDFNAAAGSECYRVLTMGPGALSNVFEPPYAGTFHGFSGHAVEDAIDWILFRGKIAVDSAWLVRERFARQYPSDHFPVMAKFRFVHPG